MVNLGINGVILRVKNNSLGETRSLNLLGKPMEKWVEDALRVPCHTIEAPTVLDISDKLKQILDKTKPITVVLYSDTPLITTKTIDVAIRQLANQKADAVKLPRGCVYKTEYLFELTKLFPQEPAGGGEFEAVTDGESLSRVTDSARRRILNFHSGNGVIIFDYHNTFIDCDVIIERGAIIEPYNFIKGKTVIKAYAHIMPGNFMENCIIGENVTVDSSRLYNSFVGAETRVGPFAYLRPNSVVGRSCRIGDYVELKNCVIGDGCKVSHLSYVGDAELGRECNVGCGVVFANYDGKNKYKSVVGNRVFIGSNANIIAPVHIADRAFIAAGSTVTDEVPTEALAIARARQTNIPHWKGNMYAPPLGEEGDEQFKLVQLENGIIDGSASESANAPQGDSQGDSQGDNGETLE